MTANKALILIDKYSRKFYRKPIRDNSVSRDVYNQRVFGNWAAMEIRDYIDKHRDWDPLMAVEEFRYAMDNFASSSTKSKNNFMFSVACDVATDILDMLLSEGGM